MGYPVPVTQATAALKTLVGYLDDLARAPFDGAATKLRLVINYAQKDDVTRSLAELLRLRMPTEPFLQRAVGERLDVPEHPATRAAFGYVLLFQLKQAWKLNLRELLSRQEFSGGGMDERWQRFAARFVTPLQEDLARVQRWLEERPQQQESVDVSALFHEALDAVLGAPGAEPVRAAPDAAPPDAGPADAALTAAVAGIADAALRADLQVDARILAIELRKTQPDAARIAELLDDLAAGGPACREAARAAVARAEAPLPAAAPAAATATAEAADVAGLRARLEEERAEVARERAALAAEREALAAERRAFEAERAAGIKKKAAKKKPAKKKAAPKAKAAAGSKKKTTKKASGR